MLPESAHTERDTTQQMYTRACTHAHAHTHTHTHTYKEWQRTKHTVCVNTFGVSLGTLEQKARFKTSHGTVRSGSECSESVLSLMTNTANKDAGLSRCIFSWL